MALHKMNHIKWMWTSCRPGNHSKVWSLYNFFTFKPFGGEGSKLLHLLFLFFLFLLQICTNNKINVLFLTWRSCMPVKGHVIFSSHFEISRSRSQQYPNFCVAPNTHVFFIFLFIFSRLPFFFFFWCATSLRNALGASKLACKPIIFSVDSTK